MNMSRFELGDRICGVHEILSVLRSLPGGADAEVQKHWEKRLKMLEEAGDEKSALQDCSKSARR